MELISQIGSSSSPETLVEQFVQTIYEHPDNLKESLRRLFNALRIKKIKNRANIAFALTQLLKKTRKSLDLDFVYNFSNEVLSQDSSTADHRRSIIALFFSWNAMCRAEIFKSRHDIILKIIRGLFHISNLRVCYRLIGYETIWSVIKTTYSSTEEFKNELFDEIVNEMGQTATPPHAESFALWIRINRKFNSPPLPLKKWALNPCSSGTLRSFSSMLEKTVAFLPQIHPIWTVLASFDPNLMIHNSMELWGNTRPPEKYIPMIATIADFEYLKVDHFIKIFEKHSKYYLDISKSKYADLFSEATIKTVERFVPMYKHRLVSLAAAIIQCVRSDKLGKFLGTLSDDDTRKLLEDMSSKEEYTFADFLELLWGQTRREKLEDLEIITNIFNQMMKRLDTDEDRKSLIPFLCHISESFSGDGKHWFSLLIPDSGIEVIPVIILNQEDLIKRSKSLLELSSKIHQIVGIEHEDQNPEITDFDSLIECSLQLLHSECKFCQSIGRFFAQSSLPFIDTETISKFKDEPLVLLKAISRQELSAAALPSLFEKINSLPHPVLSRPEKVVINIDQEGIESTLPLILSLMRTMKLKPFHVAIAQMLIDKLDEESRQQILEDTMNEQLSDFKKSADSDFIPMFIKSSFETAEKALNLTMEKLKSNKSQSMLRRARGWFEEINNEYKLEPQLIADTLKQLIDINFDPSKLGDRKRAEEVLGWLLNFMSANAEKEIPDEPWCSCLEKFANSQSRSLQLLVQLLRKPETVNNDDDKNDNE